MRYSTRQVNSYIQDGVGYIDVSEGVSWQSSRRQWLASIRVNGTSKYLGRYRELDDAKRAYALAARKHFGEFACI